MKHEALVSKERSELELQKQKMAADRQLQMAIERE
jgi:hypothetical protein